MTRRLFSTLALATLLPALVLLSGCDRHDHDDDHFHDVDLIEVRHRGTNTLLAYFQRGEADGQFQGQGVPPVEVGHEIALNVHFFDDEGRQAPLGTGEEFQLGVRLATLPLDGVEGEPGIVEFEPHGDHADIVGLAEGETHLVFQLMHGGHSDFDSPPLRIEVVEPAP